MQDRMTAFCRHWRAYMRENKTQRAGQAFMNALYQFDQATEARISQTAADCFYRDDALPLAMDLVSRMWKGDDDAARERHEGA